MEFTFHFSGPNVLRANGRTTSDKQSQRSKCKEVPAVQVSSGPAFMYIVYYMQVDTPVAGLLGGMRRYNK